MIGGDGSQCRPPHWSSGYHIHTLWLPPATRLYLCETLETKAMSVLCNNRSFPIPIHSPFDRPQKRIPPSISLSIRNQRLDADDEKSKKRLSDQSSWETKDSEGKDYLYRLGKEAENMNIAVGARKGMIDDLFVGNFLGKDCKNQKFQSLLLVQRFRLHLMCPNCDSHATQNAQRHRWWFMIVKCSTLFFDFLILQRISFSITGKRWQDRLSTFRAITTLPLFSWWVFLFFFFFLGRKAATLFFLMILMCPCPNQNSEC